MPQTAAEPKAASGSNSNPVSRGRKSRETKKLGREKLDREAVTNRYRGIA
jgi:hypothetical protein